MPLGCAGGNQAGEQNMSRAGAAVRETRDSLMTVFRNDGLRRINLAFAGSAIGDWAYATAITVWVYEVGGIVAVGVWGTIRLVLAAIVTPFASTLADKFPRKRVMVTSDLVRALLISITAYLIWAETATPAIYVLATLAGLVAAPFRPAQAALLPRLARSPEELTSANGVASTVESLAFFVGPAIGGLMLAVWSVPAVIAFNVATFLWSALLVARIQVPAKDSESQEAEDQGAEDEDEGSAGFLRESMEGFVVIGRNRDLLLVTLVYAAQTVVAGASLVFGVEIAVQMTDFGPAGIGYLDSVLGVGAILGGLVAIGRASARRLATDFGVGVVFWALPLLLAAIWPQAWAAFLAMFIIGVANPIVDVNASTIMQRLADDAVLGRVFGALETALISSMALGSILMPVMVSFWGLRWSLAALGLLITAVVLPAFVRLRSLDQRLGEPEGLPALRGLALFSPLEPKSLERVAQQLGRLEVAAGDTIIREGEVGDRFYILESGATTATFDGAVLSQQQPGDVFGEIALLRDVPRTATVVADEDSVLLYLDRDDFLAAVTGDNEVSNRADDLIARRIPTY
jgi:MFS family permease